MRVQKRSNVIKMSSKDIDNVFTGIKFNKTKEDIKENFLFELNSEDKELLLLSIVIPAHKKYRRAIVDYESFNDLFEYISKNKDNGLILPFYGEDL